MIESLFNIYLLVNVEASIVLWYGDCKANFVVVVAVAYFILSRLLYLAFSANLGLLCMLHPGMGPLV